MSEPAAWTDPFAPPTVRLAVWSGPRNISTALMRSWENRPDTVVVDEPFYASYLARTGIDHPGRDDVLASQPVEPPSVIATLTEPVDAAVAYSKQMSHHLLEGDDVSWTLAFRNVLLIREPREVVASYVRSRESCQPLDIGLLQQERLAAYWSATGVEVPILDAADVLGDPEGYLRWMCRWVGVGFTDAMLSWPAGPRDSDGVWAPYWYDAVRASTGFTTHREGPVELAIEHSETAEACRAAYDALRRRRVLLPRAGGGDRAGD